MVKNRRYEGESWFGKRHLQILLCFCCLSIAYALRVNLSVGIVAMTDKNSTNSNSVIYDWDERAKSLLLSSFFWGYVITQIPGGQIAQHYGAKYVLLFGIVTCSLMAILTPYFASIGGWRLVMGVRIIQGMMQGCVHPATHAMLAKWAPVEERGALGTYCYSGAQFGTVAMLGASGYIAQSVSGWPAIFYSSGLCGLFWGIIWFFFSASSPAEHKTISPEERMFIEKSLGNSEQSHKVHLKTPWRSICTSVPFLALLVVHCTHMWGFWTLLTQIPSYMKNILDMDIKDSALLSALPYTVMWLLSFVFIYLSKVLAKKENVSLSYSRKLFNTLGHWIPMLSLIALAYATSGQKTLAVVLLTLTVGINSATYLGFQVNHIDLSPNFAGTLMGITNAAANIMSSLAPLAVGFIVDDVTVQNQWRQVFFITAFFYFIGNLLFIILGRTNVQYWNSEADRVQQPPPRISINLSMLDIHEVSKELKKVESLK